jgi:hypothetical protein
VRITTGIAQRLVGLELGQRLTSVLARHVEIQQDDRRARRRGLGIWAVVAQVVDEILSIDDELHPLAQLCALEGVASQVAIVLVIVRHQDCDGPP